MSPKKDPMLAEAKRLYAIGAAIHWLHPRSKAPVASKWSTKAKEPWEAVEKAYHQGYNLGVRLGGASMLGVHYLAVLDLDCKSTEPRHRAEMEAFVKARFPGLGLDTPRVTTGRGNGSAHIYVLTEEPAAFERLKQSGEQVKVTMPSALKPTKYELEQLTGPEIMRGVRIRPAWEVCAMGHNQQVVVPPSVHPDTGNRYGWEFPLVDIGQLPVLTLTPKVFGDTRGLGKDGGKGKSTHRPELARNGDFTPLEIDLIGSNLPDNVVDMILSGAGVKDRSDALFTAANAMVKAGWSDDQILTVLTDPDTHLGAAAFDHAQTTSRGKAAEWVHRYTLAKAREGSDPKAAFDLVEKITDPSLSEEERLLQEDHLFGGEQWKDTLDRTSPKAGYKPLPTLRNVVLVLRGEFGKDLFQKNDFSGLQLHGADTPWARRGDEITDEHVSTMIEWFSQRWRFEPGVDKIYHAINALAAKNRFHPVRDYLKTLKWDGRPRIDTWLKDYADANAPEPYLSAVSTKLLVAMIARVFEPGCKYDQVTILEGEQGKGKSTLLRKLAGNDWFTDAHLNIADKDAVLGMRGAWLVEMGELTGMRRADVNALKEFVSRSIDRIRVPYGRRTEPFHRQCVFVGTTNLQEYLRDSTGNRRFWPVRVGKCDFDRIGKDRDQLFAEARLAYDLGETLWLDQSDAEKQAIHEQADRNESDVWVQRIGEFFSDARAKKKAKHEIKVDPDGFSTADLFDDHGPLRQYRDSKAEQMRATECLRVLGFKRVMKGHERLRIWVAP